VHNTRVTAATLFADFNWKHRYNVGGSFESYEDPVNLDQSVSSVGVFAGLALMEETTAFRLDWRHTRPDGLRPRRPDARRRQRSSPSASSSRWARTRPTSSRRHHAPRIHRVLLALAALAVAGREPRQAERRRVHHRPRLDRRQRRRRPSGRVRDRQARLRPASRRGAPSYMVKVSRAKLYLKVGLGLDQWAEAIVDGSRNSSVQIVDCSRDVHVLEKPTGKVDASMGDVHPDGNPHYWLDPRNGAIVANTIADAFAKADPRTPPQYRARAERSEGRPGRVRAERRRGEEARVAQRSSPTTARGAISPTRSASRW
jgi:hypothetical protein